MQSLVLCLLTSIFDSKYAVYSSFFIFMISQLSSTLVSKAIRLVSKELRIRINIYSKTDREEMLL